MLPPRRAASIFALALFLGCAAETPPPPATAAQAAAAGAAPAAGPPGQPLSPPAGFRVEPTQGGGAQKAPGLVALEEELARGMKELGQKGDPPPYYISYEVFDRRDVKVSGVYGALEDTQDVRVRYLDVDVRVGDYKLDSTHAIRGGFDFGFSFGGAAVPLPLEDDAQALRAVAWAETGRRYRAAAERLTKLKTQQEVKVAEEDKSDDFTRETPAVFHEAPAVVEVDVAAWQDRIRRLSARFRGQPDIHDSGVAMEAGTVNRWIVTSEGTSLQVGTPHVRITVQAGTRAEDGMDLDRFETFDAASFAGLPDDKTIERAIDTVVADLKALRKAPLADPYTGPAILEGRAAGVFFHEIFGHRIEGHRQKNEEEGQTFAKKIGQSIMPSFISVWDDPTFQRTGNVDLNGFYRFDDEGVPAQRASLVEDGVLKGFLMSRSPTRGFVKSNGHGRRQEGRTVVSRQGNLVVRPAVAVGFDELKQHLRDEVKRQNKPYGLLFRDISGGFTNTARFGPQAFKVLPILVYRVYADGRPDELVRGADLVGTPLASLGKILAAADDYSTFNGYCGAESGFVPVSATSPSLLVEQIEVERKEKGQEKPPLLPAPTIRARLTGGAR